MKYDDEITALMADLFSELGLGDVRDTELDELIAIHGLALGACGLEVLERLDSSGRTLELPKFRPVFEQARQSAFASPVSGRALIEEILAIGEPDEIEYLLLAAFLAVRSAGFEAQNRSISLIDALDDVVLSIGQNAVFRWEELSLREDARFCGTVFECTRHHAELSGGHPVFRDV